MVAIKPGGKRFRPQMSQQDVAGGVLGQQHRAEAARVAHPQRERAGKYPVHMIMHRGRLVRRDKSQAARHAQMHDLGQAGKIKQQVFSPPADGL